MDFETFAGISNQERNESLVSALLHRKTSVPRFRPFFQYGTMPVVSRFFGITIAFYWRDHVPPHFHAMYSGDEATVDIRTGEVLCGFLPRRAASLVNEWRQQHVGELLDNWERARQRQALAYIAPLE